VNRKISRCMNLATCNIRFPPAFLVYTIAIIAYRRRGVQSQTEEEPPDIELLERSRPGNATNPVILSFRRTPESRAISGHALWQSSILQNETPVSKDAPRDIRTNYKLPLTRRRPSITRDRSSKEHRPDSPRRRFLMTKATGHHLGKWASFAGRDIFAIDSCSGTRTNRIQYDRHAFVPDLFRWPREKNPLYPWKTPRPWPQCHSLRCNDRSRCIVTQYARNEKFNEKERDNSFNIDNILSSFANASVEFRLW